MERLSDRDSRWKLSFYQMIDYKKRSLQKELLDQEDIPFRDIFLNMKELEFINSQLGGHRITIKGFKKLLHNRKSISVCEIGCGGGDNLNALQHYCVKNKVNCSFTGIDLNKDCISSPKKIPPLKMPGLLFLIIERLISKMKNPGSFSPHFFVIIFQNRN